MNLGESDYKIWITYGVKRNKTYYIKSWFTDPVRAKLELLAGLDSADLEARVMADPTVRERLDGRPVVKTIVVPDKLVNIVVKG